jgi:hypothetical protein
MVFLLGLYKPTLDEFLCFWCIISLLQKRERTIKQGGQGKMVRKNMFFLFKKYQSIFLCPNPVCSISACFGDY